MGNEYENSKNLYNVGQLNVVTRDSLQKLGTKSNLKL